MSSLVIETPAEVGRWLDDLEQSVVTAEHALRRREWRALGEAIAQQRRYTHGLKNSLDATPQLAPSVRAAIDERIATILQRRALQITRLEHFHAQVGRRLRELTQFKFALRQLGPGHAPVALNTER